MKYKMLYVLLNLLLCILALGLMVGAFFCLEFLVHPLLILIGFLMLAAALVFLAIKVEHFLFLYKQGLNAYYEPKTTKEIKKRFNKCEDLQLRTLSFEVDLTSSARACFDSDVFAGNFAVFFSYDELQKSYRHLEGDELSILICENYILEFKMYKGKRKFVGAFSNNAFSALNFENTQQHRTIYIDSPVRQIDLIEHSNVHDSKVVAQHWRIENQDGSRSFRGGMKPENNPYEVTYCFGSIKGRFGQIDLWALVSNADAARQFVELFNSRHKRSASNG